MSYQRTIFRGLLSLLKRQIGDGTNRFQLPRTAFSFNYGKNIGNKNVEIPVDEGRVADYIIAL